MDTIYNNALLIFSLPNLISKIPRFFTRKICFASRKNTIISLALPLACVSSPCFESNNNFVTNLRIV